MSSTAQPVLVEVLDRALSGGPLDWADVVTLLEARERGQADLVFAAARAVREREFGQRIFLYGFVYFSTYCRNRCTFCFYRQGNRRSPRYRKSLAEIVSYSSELAASGVHLIDLTMGEDPLYFGDPRAADPAAREPHFDELVHLVRAVKEAVNLPVMISPGVVPEPVLHGLAGAGADWYACYQETHNRSLYAKLRVGQDYDERATARVHGARAGMLTEDGLLLGVGESIADRAQSILEMCREGVAQARVMGFVPQAGTPLGRHHPAATLDEQLAIAAIRLTCPDRLIPASLDVEGIAGLEPRLQAGANVVTSIVPPVSGLGGVAQAELDIDAGRRTVAGVMEHLPSLGLTAASPAEYAAWVAKRKGRQAETLSATFTTAAAQPAAPPGSVCE